MNILYICNEVNLKSGWGVVNYYTIRNAANHFKKVFVATNWNADNLSIDGVTYLPVLMSFGDGRFKPLTVFHDAARLYRLKKKINIVHILIEPYLPLARYFSDKKIIFEIHGTYSVISFRGANKSLYYKGLDCINYVISNSNYTANMFASASGYNGPLEVLGFGVDSRRFKINFYSKRGKSVLFVGAVKPRKGLLYLIGAMSKVCNKEPLAKLYVIGQTHGDRYYRNCIDSIKRLGLENNIVFVGQASDDSLISYYNKCCVVAIPSVNEGDAFEGFGLIHLEANASGIPSIGSYGCGNEDAIKHEETGFLCEQRDVDGLADIMLSIFTMLDSDKFHQLQKRCKLHAEENTWEHYWSKLLTIYRTSIGEIR